MSPGPRHISTNFNMHDTEQHTFVYWKNRRISDREHVTVSTKTVSSRATMVCDEADGAYTVQYDASNGDGTKAQEDQFIF